MRLRGLGALALALSVAAHAGEPAHTPASKSTRAKAPSASAPAAGADDAPTPPEAESEHVVKPGETLGGIAQRAKVARVLIIEANRLKPPYAVREGQKLALPRTRHHVVKAGETGFTIAFRYGVRFADIAVANGMDPEGKVKVGQDLLIPSVLKPAPAKAEGDKPEQKDEARDDTPHLLWPVEGKVRRGFATRGKTDANGDYHEGIDIIAPLGTAARAVSGGTVVFAGREPENFGNLVVVDHGDGWGSAYGFLSKITVKRGDTVKAHERVGLIGHTGRASRDELHFELRRANRPVDPLDYLPASKDEPGKVVAPKPGKRAKKP